MKLSPIMLTLANDILTRCQESLTKFVETRAETDFEELSAQGVSELTHGILDSVVEAGRYGLEKYVQGFEQDLAGAVAAKGELVRRAVRQKSFLTLLGPIELERSLFYEKGPAKGKTAFAALDEGWGMEGRRLTPDVAEAILFASAEVQPAHLEAMLEKFATFTTSRETIQDVVNGDGEQLRAHVEEPAMRAELWEGGELPEGVKVFVAGADGVNMPMREPGKKQGRPHQRPGNHAGEGEAKNSSYKNAMVGSFSTYGAAEVKVLDFDTGETRLEPQRLESLYTAKMPEEGFPTFKGEFEQTLEALESQLPAGTRKLFLCDGGRNLWRYARDTKALEDYEWMLDYYHVTEHLSLAAGAIFGGDKDSSKRWYTRWCHKLKHEDGAVGGLLRSLRSYGAKTKLGSARSAELKRQTAFFKKHRGLMNYAPNVRDGLPIATGPLEAACKMLVKQRLCRAGMRWSQDGGANVLNLRVLTKSNLWDKAWASFQREVLNKTSANSVAA